MANGSEILLGLLLGVKTLTNERSFSEGHSTMSCEGSPNNTFGVGFGHYFSVVK